MVTMEGVRRTLGPGVAFQCGAFHAAPGDRVALWGPSGCGKSTMLNLVSGLLRPHAGVIRVDGVDITALSGSRLDAFRGERYGFIFQTFNLLAPFTTLQNVVLGMRFADVVPEKEWVTRATAMLERVRLGHRLHSRPGTLSVGERQRVAIARALLKDAPVIVLDEATSAMDPLSEAAIQRAIAALETDRTVIVIAHRLRTVTEADEIIVMEGGQIVARGRHDDLLAAGGLYGRLWAAQEKAAGWRLR